jgi:hypothetical protein
MNEKKGITSSAFLATAPLSATMLAAALAQPGISDAVRIALVAGAVLVQVGYVIGNALVKRK